MQRRITFTALALLGLAASGSIASAAGDANRTWEFNQIAAAGDGGQPVPRIYYSVPQTDDVQVSGSCFVFEGAALVRLTLGADIAGMPANKEVNVQFSGGGFNYLHTGEVHKASGETGINGVDVDAEAGDPLWTAMTQQGSIDYLVPGSRAATLDFSKGRAQILKFQSACKAFAASGAEPKGMSAGVSSLDVTEVDYGVGLFQQDGPKSWVEKKANGQVAFHFIETARTASGVMLYDTSRNVFLRLDIDGRTVWYGQGVAPTTKLYEHISASSGPIGTPQVASAPAPSPPPVADDEIGAPGDESCAKQGKVRSQNSNTPTLITFDNKTGQDKVVMWIGFDGVPKDYGLIRPGQRKDFKTFLTHPWMITDLPGNCVQIEMPIANGGVNFIAVDQSAPQKTYVAPKTTYVPPKVVKRAAPVRTSCPPGTVPVPQTDNCVKVKVKATNPCPKGQYLEGATGICRKPGYANVPQTAKELVKNHGCGRTQQWNPQAKACEEND